MLGIPKERDYVELKRLGTKLHIPIPEMFWGFRVEDIASNDVVHDHEERGHSWVRNAYNLLTCVMAGVNVTSNTNYGAGYLSGKTITGTFVGNATTTMCPSYSFNLETGGTAFDGASGVTTNGIVAGTGVTAFNFDQYQLAALIAHGTGTGQMSYQAMSTYSKVYTAENSTWTITLARILNNNSAAEITVNEVGLYSSIYVGGYNSNFMLVRDILGTPVTVPAASKLTVTYTMTVAFPA